jgi:hypothetical protein
VRTYEGKSNIVRVNASLINLRSGTVFLHKHSYIGKNRPAFSKHTRLGWPQTTEAAKRMENTRYFDMATDYGRRRRRREMGMSQVQGSTADSIFAAGHKYLCGSADSV